MYTRLAWQSWSGFPTIRALAYDYPGDQKAKEVDDSFLWGTDLRVSVFMDDSTATPAKGDWKTYSDSVRYMSVVDNPSKASNWHKQAISYAFIKKNKNTLDALRDNVEFI